MNNTQLTIISFSVALFFSGFITAYLVYPHWFIEYIPEELRIEHPPCPSLEIEVNEGTSGQTNILRPLIVTPNPNCDRLENIVLSIENDTALKNNIGFIFVDKAKITTQPTNVDYCDLALFLWNGHTYDDRERLQKTIDELGHSNYIFPEYCYNEIPNAQVPEFGGIVAMILTIGVILTIGLATKNKLKLGL